MGLHSQWVCWSLVPTAPRDVESASFSASKLFCRKWPNFPLRIGKIGTENWDFLCLNFICSDHFHPIRKFSSKFLFHGCRLGHKWETIENRLHGISWWGRGVEVCQCMCDMNLMVNPSLTSASNLRMWLDGADLRWMVGSKNFLPPGVCFKKFHVT